TLILYTDGVADELQEGQTEWLMETALNMSSLEPDELARRLVQAAAERQGRRDDMSAVAVRIERSAP
ncbi:MAG: SpoIIE family protein phosphatase, partial [Clostridia bacterium]|nr:SpoIIE family protein phosphatase [Clostridia bacterium]